MAPDPEPRPAAEDTVLIQSGASSGDDEVTQAGDEWPVTDLYYVEPEEDAPPEAAPPEAETASAAGPGRRRLVPSLALGPTLLMLSVLGVLLLGAALLATGNDDPAAAPQAPTEEATTAPETETPTTPTPSAEDVAVADVEGMRVAEAREVLESEGLRVRVTRSSSDRPRGEILSQAPQAESKVARGTVVALVVSGGADTTTAPARAEVPDVVGQSASKATSTIRDAELEARVRLVPSTERAGRVVSQQPRAGARVAEGSTILLRVAKAPAVRRIEVPDVVGSTAAAARAELRDLGFTVRTVAVRSDEPAGTVISQSPRAASEVKEGSAIRLTVSSGPTEVDVPDVTGLDEASARAELERAGFEVRVTDESTSDPAQDGMVLRQTPQGGSSAEEGAIVTITVGRFD